MTITGNISHAIDVYLDETDAKADIFNVTGTLTAGAGSIIVNTINLINDREGETEITLAAPGSTLAAAYAFTNVEIVSPGSYSYTYGYDYESGILTLNGVLSNTLADKVHEGDPAVRTFDMTDATGTGADETVGEDLGQLQDGSGAKLTIEGGNHKIIGGTWEGITVSEGQTLIFNNVSDVTGFADDTAVTNGGTLEIKDSKFTSKIANNASMTLKGTTNTLNGAISGSNGQTTVSEGTATFGADLTQKDLTVAQGAGVVIDADNLNITKAVKNDGTVTLSDGTLKSSIDNNEATTGKTVIDGAVSITSGKAINQAIEIASGSGNKLTADAASIGGVVTNSATVELTGGELAKNISGTTGEVDITTGTVTNSANISAKSVVIDSTLNTAADAVSATDGITNNGTLVLSAGEIQSNIQKGSSNGTVNIAAGTDGIVSTTHDITNQTVNVNTGTLYLNLGSDYATQIAGSTVNVANGAILNTMDSFINDYSSIVKLAQNAVVQADINSTTIDKYGVASSAVTAVTLGAINALNAGNFQEHEFQLIDGDVTVEGESIQIYSVSGKTVSVKGSGNADGKVLVSESASTSKLNGAVYVSPTKTAITYEMEDGETVNLDRPALGHVKDIFTIQSSASGETNRRTIEANSFTKGLIVDSGHSLTVNNVEFKDFETGVVNATTHPTADPVYYGNYEGIITVQNGASLTVIDSYFTVVDGDGNTNKIAIVNYGTLDSDPTTYNGAIINYSGATASITGDTFTGIIRTGEDGGAVYNESTSPYALVLNNDTFTNNQAKNGGALFNQGVATVNGGTFTGNQATNLGGAIYTSANLTISADSTNGPVSFSNNKHKTAATEALNDIYMAGTTLAPVTLYLNAQDTTNTLTLDSGVDGANYSIDVNGASGMAGTVTIASIANATGISLHAGTLATTNDVNVNALSVGDTSVLNAGGTKGLTTASLTVADAATFTNSGKLIVNGTLTNGTDGATSYGKITNNGTLTLVNDGAVTDNVGKIQGTGNLVIGDGTHVTTVTNSGANASITGNDVEIKQNAKLVISADDITDKDSSIVNNGTLELTGAVPTGLAFNSSVTGTNGTTEISDGIVTLASAYNIAQAINITQDTSDPSDIKTGVLEVANAASIQGAVTNNVENGLVLKGGTLGQSVSKPTTGINNDASTKIAGTVNITSSTVKIAQDINIASGSLEVSDAASISGTSTNELTITAANTTQLILDGGTLSHTEVANDTSATTGKTVINGTNVVVDNTSLIATNVEINSGKALTISGAVYDTSVPPEPEYGLFGAVTNAAGTLNVTGGQIIAAISGAGNTHIQGAVNVKDSTSIANAITIDGTNSLTTNADNIDNGVTNSAGTLVLTGGSLDTNVTGAGTTSVTGANVQMLATATNANKIEIVEGG